MYRAFADSGWAGEVFDENYVRTGYYELPDDMFSADSGWVYWCCDACEHTWWQRSRPGGKVTCPLCDTEGTVPENAVMGEYEGDLDGPTDDD